MKVDVESVDGGEAKILVEVDPGRVESYLDRAYGKIRNQVRIPGFRRGKAPRFIFERFMGKKTLLEDALKMLLPDSCSDALKQAQVKPFESPNLEVLEFDADKPLKFRASVLVRPEVSLADPSELVVREEKAEPAEGEVDAEIEKLRERFAELEPVEGRPVTEEDVVYVSARPFVDGSPTEDSAQQMTVDMTDAPQGFEKLKGAAPGDERTVVSSFPPDYPDSRLAGKEVTYQIKVEDIKKKKLPDLDDEFAATVGGFANLQELREHISNNLKEAHEERSSAAFVERAVEVLVDASTVDLPPALIEKRTSDMVRDFERRMTSSSKSLEDVLKEQGKTLEDLRGEMREAAISSLKRQLVLDAVVEKYDIQVPQDEMEKIVTELARAQNRDPKEFIAALQAGGFEDLRASLARSRGAEFLKTLVKKSAE